MRIVLAGLQLDWLGGAETYLMTVGTALQRLAHEVVLFAPEHGYAARAAQEQGLNVVADVAALPVDADAVLANDGASALELRARYPGAPVAQVLHNEEEAVYAPSALAGALHA